MIKTLTLVRVVQLDIPANDTHYLVGGRHVNGKELVGEGGGGSVGVHDH